MRALELGKIAIDAEKVRLQQMTLRQLRRLVYLTIAVIFACGAICMIHVLLWQVLRGSVEAIWTSAILLAIDVVVAGGFGLMGVRSRAGHAERVADARKRDALKQASLYALIPAATMLGRVTRNLWVALIRRPSRVGP